MNTNRGRIRAEHGGTRQAMAVLAVATAIAGTFAALAQAGSAVPVAERSGVSVSGINDHGQIIGTVTRHGKSHGFMWRNRFQKLVGLVEADAINNRGEILGKNAEAHYVLWDKGRLRKIDLTSVISLNNRGQILGLQGSTPALWTDGTIRILPLSSLIRLPAMNDLGQVVGETAAGHVEEWQNGKLTDLGPGVAIAINDRGEIVGGGPSGQMTVWQSGVATDIGGGEPIAINNRGQVIGTVELGPGIPHAFLWSNGTMTVLGRGLSIPTAISRSGQVVGYYFNGQNQFGFVWQHGNRIRLRPPEGHRFLPTRAVAINDHDQIVGDDCLPQGEHCVRNGGPKGFAVRWALQGRTVKTMQIVEVIPEHWPRRAILTRWASTGRCTGLRCHRRSESDV